MSRPTSRRPATLRALGIALLAALALQLAAPAALGAKGDRKGGEGKGGRRGTPGFFATTFGRSERELVVVHYWSKGTYFRSETIIAGHPIVTVVRDADYYTWDALTRQGYVIRRTDAAVAQDRRRKRPFGLELEDLIADGGEKIRSESLNGLPSDVYRVTDESGRRTLWVSTDPLQLPLRLETFERRSGRSGVLDWVSWMPGLVIPDDFFKPPDKLELHRFDGYEEYIERIREGPIPPTPPLFHHLLHQRGGAEEDD